MKQRLLAFAAISLLILAAAPAMQASFITFDAVARGWINSDGSPNGSYPTNNYIAGGHRSGLEYRNWFAFEPVFAGKAIAAALVLDTVWFRSPQGTETYQITSLGPSFSFSDLGTGTVYATRVYSSSDYNRTVTIPLNAAAVADITSGQVFRVSGRMITLDSDPRNDEYAFGASQGSSHIARLSVTTELPEPSTSLLVGFGLLGLSGLRRRHGRR